MPIFFDFRMPDFYTIENILLDHLNGNKKIRIIIYEDEYALTIEDYQPPDKKFYHGVKIMFSQYMVHPQLAKIKSGNYLPYYLAGKEAKENGVYESLLKNGKGYIVDGSKSAFLRYYDGRLELACGGLESIMARQACKFAQGLGIQVSGKYFTQADLEKGLILLCNSMMGLVSVATPQCEFVKMVVNKFAG